ncbi:HK97 gp10 family phage protein [Lysinibacillus sp. KU-BSD001]|uniref:HK97 gp10 family phage protein n=1 Tax=Lysinibacillus sp. KU-BSD001 TaxID=3141328 RepID=UPI0036ED559E
MARRSRIRGAINVNSLASEIVNALEDYREEIAEEIDLIAGECAKQAVRMLKRSGPELTGDYRKGWRATKINGVWRVHNATDYQLTHLLEKGHAKVGGGRVEAIPHIEPVERTVVRKYINDVMEVVRS